MKTYGSCLHPVSDQHSGSGLLVLVPTTLIFPNCCCDVELRLCPTTLCKISNAVQYLWCFGHFGAVESVWQGYVLCSCTPAWNENIAPSKSVVSPRHSKWLSWAVPRIRTFFIVWIILVHLLSYLLHVWYNILKIKQFTQVFKAILQADSKASKIYWLIWMEAFLQLGSFYRFEMESSMSVSLERHLYHVCCMIPKSPVWIFIFCKSNCLLKIWHSMLKISQVTTVLVPCQPAVSEIENICMSVWSSCMSLTAFCRFAQDSSNWLTCQSHWSKTAGKILVQKDHLLWSPAITKSITSARLLRPMVISPIVMPHCSLVFNLTSRIVTGKSWWIK